MPGGVQAERSARESAAYFRKVSLVRLTRSRTWCSGRESNPHATMDTGT